MLQGLVRNFSFAVSEERIRNLINSLHVGVLVMSPGKELLFNNQVALNLPGLSAGKLYGRGAVNSDWSIAHEDESLFTCDFRKGKGGFIFPFPKS